MTIVGEQFQNMPNPLYAAGVRCCWPCVLQADTGAAAKRAAGIRVVAHIAGRAPDLRWETA